MGGGVGCRSRRATCRQRPRSQGHFPPSYVRTPASGSSHGPCDRSAGGRGWPPNPARSLRSENGQRDAQVCSKVLLWNCSTTGPNTVLSRATTLASTATSSWAAPRPASIAGRSALRALPSSRTAASSPRPPLRRRRAFGPACGVGHHREQTHFVVLLLSTLRTCHAASNKPSSLGARWICGKHTTLFP